MRTESIESLAYLLKQSEPNQAPRFIFFLGAGASESSGIPIASWMIRDFKRKLRQLWQSEGKPLGDFDSWLESKPGWEDNDSLYAKCFEAFEPTEFGRARYLERWMRTASPGWGYFALSQLLARSYIDTVVTTNFDDLIYESCTLYSVRRPRVYSAMTPYTSIEPDHLRPTIIKLHGDYLYANLRNTTPEMQDVDDQLMAQVSGLFQHHEVVVLGYSGSDMRVMRELFSKIPSSNAIYWCTYRDDDAPRAVDDLASNARRSHWFQIRTEGFDRFMDELVNQLDLSLPSIVEPIQDLIDAIPGRIEGSGSRYRVKYFDEAIQQLKREEQELAEAFGGSSITPTPYRLRLEAMRARIDRRYDEAITLYSQLTSFRRQATCEVLIEYAVTLELMGEYGEARDRALAIEQKVTKPDDLGNYGVLLADLGEYDRSVQHLERAISQAPGARQWQVALTMILSEYAQLDESLDRAAQLTEMHPYDGRVWAARSMIHSLKGDYGVESLEFADKAVSFNRDGFDENLSRAFALSGSGNHIEAIATLDQIEVDDDKNIWHRALGHFQLLATDSVGAVYNLRQAVDWEKPAIRPKTMMLLGVALLTKGDFEEAKEAFERVCSARDMKPRHRIDDDLAFAVCELGVGNGHKARDSISAISSKHKSMKGLLNEYAALLRIMEQHQIDDCGPCLDVISEVTP